MKIENPDRERQPKPTGFMEFQLYGGGTAMIRRKEVAEVVLTDYGYTILRTKTGGTYKVVADYNEVANWATATEAA